MILEEKCRTQSSNQQQKIASKQSQAIKRVFLTAIKEKYTQRSTIISWENLQSPNNFSQGNALLSHWNLFSSKKTGNMGLLLSPPNISLEKTKYNPSLAQH